MVTWHIPPGAGKDIRCSQTALSKRCRRKASEKSSGSLTHSARHQQGSGQCFKVDLGFCLLSCILHHTIWREYSIALSFLFQFSFNFFHFCLLLVLVCNLLFLFYSFLMSPLCCIFTHLCPLLSSPYLLTSPLPSISVTVFFLALHSFFHRYIFFSTFKWPCHIVTTSGHPH